MPVVVGIVAIPSSQVFARSGLSDHGAEGLEEGIFAEIHEDGVSQAELLFVQGAIEGDIAIAEFLERCGGGGVCGVSHGGPGEADDAGGRGQRGGLQEGSAGNISRRRHSTSTGEMEPAELRTTAGSPLLYTCT